VRSISGSQLDAIGQHVVDTTEDVFLLGAGGLHGVPEEVKQFLDK
jgi:hypothetical protein